VIYRARTRVRQVDALTPQPEVIAQAAGVIRRGGLVAFPTETVYGLGAAALDAAAVARIFAAKGRPAYDPVIVHIAETRQLDEVAQGTPALAYELAERFWPGPLTLVLQKAPAVPSTVTAGGPTVAVRMPAHPVALALIRAAGPVAAPSANRFARPSPTSAAHVLEDLRGRVDLVLDGGQVPIGVESTVLDLTGDPPTVLRPGGTPFEALQAVIPGVRLTARLAGAGEATPSPGMLAKHYSPRAEVLLIDGLRDAALARLLEEARSQIAARRRVGALLVDEDLSSAQGLPIETAALGPASDLEGVARALFDALRDLDRRGVDVILVRGLPREGLGLAIWDRLLRAAEGRVIRV